MHNTSAMMLGLRPRGQVPRLVVSLPKRGDAHVASPMGIRLRTLRACFRSGGVTLVCAHVYAGNCATSNEMCNRRERPPPQTLSGRGPGVRIQAAEIALDAMPVGRRIAHSNGGDSSRNSDKEDDMGKAPQQKKLAVADPYPTDPSTSHFNIAPLPHITFQHRTPTSHITFQHRIVKSHPFLTSHYNIARQHRISHFNIALRHPTPSSHHT